MFRFLCEAAGNNQPKGGQLAVYAVLIVFLILMLVLPYFTQRKKSKEYEAMLNSINVGDLVKTAGGIIGRVKNITDKGEVKTVVLETGSKTDKSYLELDITMIYCVLKSTKPAQTTEEDDDEVEDVLETEETTEEVKTETNETVEEVKTETVEDVKEEVTEETKTEVEEKKEETKPQNKPAQKKPIQKKNNSSKKKK